MPYTHAVLYGFRALQVYCLNGVHSYEVPRGEVRLGSLFRTMAAAMAGERTAGGLDDAAAASSSTAGNASLRVQQQGSGTAKAGGVPSDRGGGGGGGIGGLVLLDWAVSSATLESVFVRIAREADSG